jgi:hypothetical protein
LHGDGVCVTDAMTWSLLDLTDCDAHDDAAGRLADGVRNGSVRYHYKLSEFFYNESWRCSLLVDVGEQLAEPWRRALDAEVERDALKKRLEVMVHERDAIRIAASEAMAEVTRLKQQAQHKDETIKHRTLHASGLAENVQRLRQRHAKLEVASRKHYACHALLTLSLCCVSPVFGTPGLGSPKLTTLLAETGQALVATEANFTFSQGDHRPFRPMPEGESAVSSRFTHHDDRQMSAHNSRTALAASRSPTAAAVWLRVMAPIVAIILIMVVHAVAFTTVSAAHAPPRVLTLVTTFAPFVVWSSAYDLVVQVWRAFVPNAAYLVPGLALSCVATAIGLWARIRRKRTAFA